MHYKHRQCWKAAMEDARKSAMTQLKVQFDPVNFLIYFYVLKKDSP